MSEPISRPTEPARPTEPTRPPTEPVRPRVRYGRRDRVVAILLAVACVLVTGVAVELSDKLEDLKATRTVQVGESASLDGGTITVTKVEAATDISDGADYDEKFLTTKGMFLVLTIRYAVPGEENSVGAIGGLPLYTSDRTYNAFGNNMVMKVRAGFVGTGNLLFEVDPDHIDGAYIRLLNKEMFYVTPQVVRVDLGIDEENAAQWYRSAKGRSLTAEEFSEKPIP